MTCFFCFFSGVSKDNSCPNHGFQLSGGAFSWNQWWSWHGPTPACRWGHWIFIGRSVEKGPRRADKEAWRNTALSNPFPPMTQLQEIGVFGQSWQRMEPSTVWLIISGNGMGSGSNKDQRVISHTNATKCSQYYLILSLCLKPGMQHTGSLPFMTGHIYSMVPFAYM